ncbi:MAG: DUF2867 domain-containing protein [Rudaea sp.]|uniref:DUF2867 domain-containing protein n=1 Tax=unclassified Rudaea TaxID=2627037 RepID=UPI0010F6A6AE|nr:MULTISPECIES: DUF2867 domain-containing protein [unclassified Rudaea]MBN8884344.1 DUF2867 domain-containing protein [Rudaea sp.]MBR0344678.1 DUF2867 domain-containing protein [Rudaea sp.]
MPALAQSVATFPTARLHPRSGALPVEVSLIAQLGHGAGDALFASATRRQQAHEHFVDELDEPSARLGAMDLAKGDASSLYSFAVGPKGHPFHRHAGHRVFTAVSGSGGARLRFSGASHAEIERDPQSFVRSLRQVDIPPDSLFTVRFGGETWHQFGPVDTDSKHPTLFALSCHTNELGGALTEPVRERILAGDATIPALTELLPERAAKLLDDVDARPAGIATIALSFDAPAGSALARFCKHARSSLGRIRTAAGALRKSPGFLADSTVARRVEELGAPAEDSLLSSALAGQHHHQDTFRLTLGCGEMHAGSASACLALLLDGFVDNPPAGVSRLMKLRNFLVKPLGLRTSPLGCPVSSLLGRDDGDTFAGRFPVLAQSIDAGDTRAQVLLGADDKHLRFRSCVGVQMLGDGRIVFSLGTRVACKNLFGRFYMAAIDRTHRRYIAPAMLRMAVDHAIRACANDRLA